MKRQQSTPTPNNMNKGKRGAKKKQPTKIGGISPALIPLVLPLNGKVLLTDAMTSRAAYGAEKILGSGLHLSLINRVRI